MVARSPDSKRSASPVAAAIRSQYSSVGPGRLDYQEDEAIAELAGICAPQNRDGARLKSLLDEGRHNEAYADIQRLLEESVDFDAVYFLIRLLVDTKQAPFAAPLAELMALKWPDDHRSWLSKGLSDTHLRRTEEAVIALEKSLAIRESAIGYALLASAYVMRHDFEKAEKAAKKSLAIKEHHIPHVALAFCHLQNRRWKEGWKEYTYQMGRDSDRAIKDFGLPEWEGKGSVLIYGEQGLGDQLCYTSAIDGRCKQLACHPKLSNLLARSLDIEVYGDQFAEKIDWTPNAQYQSSMATAMQWQEVKRRGRWLKPHPEKKIQWQALVHNKARVKDRLNVGLAWNGGRMLREQKARGVIPEQLKPLLDLPFNFISLEYKSHENIPNVQQWEWATQTSDLDDFAALVDCLDVVVTVPTTTYHIAGSLGIPCHVLVHEKPHFHEGVSGDCPWWESVTFYRGDRDKAIVEIAEKLLRL